MTGLTALTATQRGERVLKLACGPDGVGLTVAGQVVPGEAVTSDVALMTAIAPPASVSQCCSQP